MDIDRIKHTIRKSGIRRWIFPIYGIYCRIRNMARENRIYRHNIKSIELKISEKLLML